MEREGKLTHVFQHSSLDRLCGIVIEGHQASSSRVGFTPQLFFLPFILASNFTGWEEAPYPEVRWNQAMTLLSLSPPSTLSTMDRWEKEEEGDEGGGMREEGREYFTHNSTFRVLMRNWLRLLEACDSENNLSSLLYPHHKSVVNCACRAFLLSCALCLVLHKWICSFQEWSLIPLRSSSLLHSFLYTASTRPLSRRGFKTKKAFYPSFPRWAPLSKPGSFRSSRGCRTSLKGRSYCCKDGLTMRNGWKEWWWREITRTCSIWYWSNSKCAIRISSCFRCSETNSKCYWWRDPGRGREYRWRKKEKRPRRDQWECWDQVMIE